MILVIDAHNIDSGGGIAYLVNILKYAVCNDVGFTKIYIFGSKRLKDELQTLLGYKLIFMSHRLLDGNFFQRLSWHKFVFPKECHRLRPHLVYCPGGLTPMFNREIKLATISLNVLPFHFEELSKDNLWLTVRRLMQRHVFFKSYSRADGIIFPSRYGQGLIVKKLGETAHHKSVIIPLGIDLDYYGSPVIENESRDSRILLYVSSMKSYKNHFELIKAFARLDYIKENLRLIIIGKGDASICNMIHKSITKLKMQGYIELIRMVSSEELLRYYQKAFIFVFASSVESCPNILLEAMTVGCPIACSNAAPMPEFAGNGAVYFDPKDVESIHQTLSLLIVNKELRKNIAKQARILVQKYSLDKCAKDTFEFLLSITREKGGAH